MAEPIGFGERTGAIDLFDWDEAVAEHINAVKHPKGLYVLPVRDIIPARRMPEFRRKRVRLVLVLFKDPEPHVLKATLPRINIIRDSVDPDDVRLTTGINAYRCPAEGSPIISAGGELGAQTWEMKDQEEPTNLIYTIEVRARTRSMAQVLIQVVAQNFALRGGISITDSLGVSRRYTTYFESGPSDLMEVNSVIERVAGFSVSFKIEGALTKEGPFFAQGFTGAIRPKHLGPFDPNDPDPGEFGYYGEGTGGDLTVEPIFPTPPIVDC